MGRIIPLGEQCFSTLRHNNLFYIDKTRFISDWWTGHDPVTLITRPRRFGKTLMLDTVRTFFSREYANQEFLFKDLEIWKHEEFRRICGTIPVIFLSFASVKADDYAECIRMIKEILVNVYDEFRFILNTSSISASEEEQINAVRQSMDDFQAKSSLQHLCKYLFRHYNIRPIILLDEYDTPLQEAWLHGYWKDLVGFLRGFFNATFKTNFNLGRGLLTGITRVAKESIFSDLNNCRVVSITSDLYSDCFGFTETEVFAAMDEYGLTNKADVKRWYDGFIFGSQKEIYNPWSIVSFLSEKKFDTYWADTSSNALVGELIAHSGVECKEQTEKLLSGSSFVTKLDEQIVFSELYTKQGAIWSLLMASGYVQPIAFESETKTYELAVTNYESRRILEEKISEWFGEVRRSKNSFCTALLADNLQDMNTYLSDIAEKTFSYFDVGKKEPERFYHAFVLGLIIDLKGLYRITSNRESGYGRYDVILIPEKKGNHGIVIEFKVMGSDNEKTLEETCARALKQICQKKYSTALHNCSVPDHNIYVYGFSFKGKQVLIRGGAYEIVNT